MTGFSATPGSPASDDRRSTAVAGLMRCLQQAAQAAALYGGEHPTVRNPCAAAVAHLADVPAEFDPLTIGIMGDGIVAAGIAPNIGSELAALIHTMHSRDIGAIELDRSVDEDAIRELAVALRPTAAPGEAQVGRGFDGRGIRLLPVNYRLLRAGEAAPAGDAPSDGPMWIGLSNLSRTTEGASPEELAGKVNAIAGPTLAAGDAPPELPEWRRELQEMGRDIEVVDGGDRVRLLRQLSSFLSSCDPRVRRALMPAGSGGESGSFALLEALLPVLPLEEVLDALEHVDYSNAEPSPEAVRLHRRLGRIARRVPAQRDRIEGLAHRAGVTIEEPEPAAFDVSKLVGQLLTRQRSMETGPSDHESHLDSATVAGAHARVASDLMRPADVRCRAAEIAVSVIESLPDDTPAGDGPFEFVSRVATDLVQRDRLDLVVLASRGARRHGGAAVDGGESIGARRLVERTSESRFVQLVLDRTCDGTCALEEVLELLESGGAAAMSQILLRLSGDMPRDVRTKLQTMVLAADYETLLEAVRGLARSGDDHLQSIFAVLNSMPPDGAVEFLQPLCVHREPEVRRLAFSALAKSGWVWPHTLLEHAIRDPESSIFDLAVERLGCQRDARSVELIEQVLAGCGARGRRLPEPRRFDRLARLLLDQPDGPRRVAELLDALRFPPGLQRADRALRLVWLLRGTWRRPEIRPALRRWLLSPAPVLGLLPSPADFGEDDV